MLLLGARFKVHTHEVAHSRAEGMRHRGTENLHPHFWLLTPGLHIPKGRTNSVSKKGLPCWSINNGLGKENRALGRRLRCAKLKQRAVIEVINYQHPRRLDRRLLRTLASNEWVRQKLNLVFTGPTGIGKSWLACALAQKACREGFSILHKKTSELFRELAVAHADGSMGRMLLRLAQIDVLLLDDFAMAPMKDSERHDFLEACDDRYQHRSMILTSQMPVALGTNRSAIPPLPTASSTGCCTTPTA
jgi:DNA replication protein DnaC